MNLPSVEEVRQRISGVQDEPIRYCLMTLYLYAGRISEVVGHVNPTDESVAGGPRGSDAYRDRCLLGDKEIECVVFKIKTSKRQGMERRVALPLAEEYEPWAAPVYGYFLQRSDTLVFPFTRQYVWRWVTENKVFAGLTCPIEKYKNEKHEPVASHNRAFKLHALRHLRASELVGFYGFDGFNLATYGGWTYHRMAETTSIMDRYLSLSWQSYFAKLLKKKT